jgi:hypothetical protein
MDTNQMPTIERIRLGDLAARLGCTLRGDPEIEITGVAGVEEAGPSDLTFLANPKYGQKGSPFGVVKPRMRAKQLYDTRISSRAGSDRALRNPAFFEGRSLGAMD